MYRLFLISFFVSSLSLFSAGPGKEPKNNTETASVEANVINTTCGYMLQLSDGQLLHAVNLPKKFCSTGERVVLILDEVKTVQNTPCDVQKEVHIAEIKSYRPSPDLKGKF